MNHGAIQTATAIALRDAPASVKADNDFLSDSSGIVKFQMKDGNPCWIGEEELVAQHTELDAAPVIDGVVFPFSYCASAFDGWFFDKLPQPGVTVQIVHCWW